MTLTGARDWGTDALGCLHLVYHRATDMMVMSRPGKQVVGFAALSSEESSPWRSQDVVNSLAVWPLLYLHSESLMCLAFPLTTQVNKRAFQRPGI